MTNLKMAHSIPYNLWAAKCWHIELNCTLLSNKLAAQPRHLGTVSAYAPGQVSIEGIGSWEVNLNQKKKKKRENKKISVSKGKCFELTLKRKRDGDQDLACCCLLAWKTYYPFLSSILFLPPTQLSSMLLMMILPPWMIKM